MKRQILFGLLMLLALAGRMVGASEIYERKVLFSLRYGTAANEIRMAEDESAILRGPSTLTADAAGNVLIGSRASRLVKKFSPSGKLLGMVACDAWHLAPDSKGGFYALADYRSDDGERRGLKVARYDLRGKSLYALYPDFFRSILSDERVDADWPRGIETDSGGNLYCQFRGKTIKLSPSGKFLLQVPSAYFNSRPESYDFAPTSAAPGATIRVRRLSERGSEVGSARLKVNTPELKAGELLFLSFYDEEDEPARELGAAFVDDAGNIYLSAVSEMREPVSLLDGALQIPGRRIIQKYSPDGKFLTEIQFMAEPTGEFPSFEVTRKGEIYQLDYRSDHLEVVRWTPKSSAAPAAGAKSGKGIRR